MHSLRLALFQPEIAANVGAAIRTAACFGASVHVIDPCGFPWKSREIDRVALDYGDISPPQRHISWAQFREDQPGRLVLLTTRGATSIYDTAFAENDILLMGQESAGVPEDIHGAANARVFIPLAPPARSLNVTVAAAVALAEARRQVGF